MFFLGCFMGTDHDTYSTEVGYTHIIIVTIHLLIKSNCTPKYGAVAGDVYIPEIAEGTWCGILDLDLG